MKIHRIHLPLPFKLNHIYVHLVQGPEGFSLVDTGLDMPQARKLLISELAQHGIEPNELSHVFLSHFHGDHWGMAHWFNELGVPITMSRVDWQALDQWFDQPTADARSVADLVEMGAPREVIAGALRGIGGMRLACPAFKPDHLVDDGDVVTLSGVDFRVVYTPGHTPGHSCLYQEEAKALILGDHILPDITPHIALDSLDLLPDPLAAYRRSLEKIRQFDVAENWPSHGEPIADLNKRIDELLAHHTRREDQMIAVIAAANTPLTCYEVSQGLFELRELDDFAGWLAASETLAHLRFLVNQGRATVQVDGDILRYGIEYV